jgi:hypothetical protein
VNGIAKPAYILPSLLTYCQACLRIAKPAYVLPSLLTYCQACLRIAKPAYVFDSLPFLADSATNYFCSFVFFYVGSK